MWSLRYNGQFGLVDEKCRIGAYLGERSLPASDASLFVNATTSEKSSRCRFFLFDDQGVASDVTSAKSFAGMSGKKPVFAYRLIRSPELFSQPERAMHRIRCCAQDLGTGKIDILFVPWPAYTAAESHSCDTDARDEDTAAFLQCWNHLSALVTEGTIEAMGVSELKQWQADALLHSGYTLPKAALYTISLSKPRQGLVDYCFSHGLQVIADVRFQTKDREQLLVAMGGGEDTGKMSYIQVFLAWALKRGLVVALSFEFLLDCPSTTSSSSTGDESIGGGGMLPIREREIRIKNASESVYSMMHPLCGRAPYFTPGSHGKYEFEFTETLFDTLENLGGADEEDGCHVKLSIDPPPLLLLPPSLRKVDASKARAGERTDSPPLVPTNAPVALEQEQQSKTDSIKALPLQQEDMPPLAAKSSESPGVGAQVPESPPKVSSPTLPSDFVPKDDDECSSFTAGSASDTSVVLHAMAQSQASPADFMDASVHDDDDDDAGTECGSSCSTSSGSHHESASSESVEPIVNISWMSSKEDVL
jgi:hypothetical protein